MQPSASLLRAGSGVACFLRDAFSHIGDLHEACLHHWALGDERVNVQVKRVRLAHEQLCS